MKTIIKFICDKNVWCGAFLLGVIMVLATVHCVKSKLKMKTIISLVCFWAGIASAQPSVSDIESSAGHQFDHYRLLVKNGKLPNNDDALVQKAFDDIQVLAVKEGIASPSIIKQSLDFEKLINEIESRE